LPSTGLGGEACVPGDRDARNGDPCFGFADCTAGSICLLDSSEYPGGQCAQLACTLGDDGTCTAGGHCTEPELLATEPVCVDSCTSGADCREAEGYRCFDGGTSAGRYCRHPKVGDACSTADDCGGSPSWRCLTGPAYPGGSCTLGLTCNATNSSGCRTASNVCHDPPGDDRPHCVDRCTGSGQSTCRTGYACVPTGPLFNGCVAP
jgi:hypothetical protein